MKAAARWTYNARTAATVTPMQDTTFELERDHVELNQLLKLVGLCDSGGAGKMLVAEGVVTVDGRPELRRTCKIRSGQTVCCGGLRIHVTGPR